MGCSFLKHRHLHVHRMQNSRCGWVDANLNQLICAVVVNVRGMWAGTPSSVPFAQKMLPFLNFSFSLMKTWKRVKMHRKLIAGSCPWDPLSGLVALQAGFAIFFFVRSSQLFSHIGSLRLKDLLWMDIPCLHSYIDSSAKISLSLCWNWKQL